MGRESTGVWSTSECRKLDLCWMLKNGWIKKGAKTSGQMEWTDGSSAGIECLYTKDEAYLRVKYTITDRHGKETNHDYKIELISVPSNLGKGEVLYFECPESGKRARVLYMAYRHHKYLHRDWYLERYGVRVYYKTQHCSKRDYDNTRYHDIVKQIERLEDELFVKNKKTHYRGKPTKGFQRLYKLREQRDYHNYKRNIIFYENIRNMGMP
ncbi:hypothetical protein JYT76_03590 [Olleya sp. AH-315-F22]|nr:hypothetical protein [Olleya sp. AH-315-F22]